MTTLSLRRLPRPNLLHALLRTLEGKRSSGILPVPKAEKDEVTWTDFWYAVAAICSWIQLGSIKNEYSDLSPLANMDNKLVVLYVASLAAFHLSWWNKQKKKKTKSDICLSLATHHPYRSRKKSIAIVWFMKSASATVVTCHPKYREREESSVISLNAKSLAKMVNISSRQRRRGCEYNVRCMVVWKGAQWDWRICQNVALIRAFWGEYENRGGVQRVDRVIDRMIRGLRDLIEDVVEEFCWKSHSDKMAPKQTALA